MRSSISHTSPGKTCLLALVLLGLLQVVGPPQAAAAVRPIPEPPCADTGCFDVANAMAVDRQLSVDIGPRAVGTAGGLAARDYIAAAMTSLGLATTLQEVPIPNGLLSWNVIGVPTADVMDAGPYLIVGGHYDTVSRSPGANDNATGVAAVLDIARALHAQPSPLPVVFVAFGAEELQPGTNSGMFGSRRFVSQMTAAQKANLRAFVNLDYVGYGNTVILRHTKRTKLEATNRLRGLAASMGIATRVKYMSTSDDAPFKRAGLNAGSLRGQNDPNYHTPQDTFDKLKPDPLHRAGRLALAALRSYED